MPQCGVPSCLNAVGIIIAMLTPMLMVHFAIICVDSIVSGDTNPTLLRCAHSNHNPHYANIEVCG